MEQYIPKSAVAAEIERNKKHWTKIESVLPCVVKDGIIYDKIKDKIKELRNE